MSHFVVYILITNQESNIESYFFEYSLPVCNYKEERRGHKNKKL